MALVDITFTGVTITDPTLPAHTGTLTGTLAVTYATRPALGGTVTGTLTFSGTGIGGTQTYTSFTLTQSVLGGPYTLTFTAGSGHQTLTLHWTSQTPSSLTSASLVDPTNGHTYTVLNPLNNHLTSVPCFAAGTLIRTPRGDVSVESLQVGDVVVTASGEHRPVKWIGHSDFDLRGHPDPRPTLPVRIAPDAFGPGRPSQDLYISSGHSICIDLCGEVLIPAGLLSMARPSRRSRSKRSATGMSNSTATTFSSPTIFRPKAIWRWAIVRSSAKPAQPSGFEGGERTYADFRRPVATDGPVVDFVRERLDNPGADARLDAVARRRSSSPRRRRNPPSARRGRRGRLPLSRRRSGRSAHVEYVRPGADWPGATGANWGFPCTGSPSWAQAQRRDAFPSTTLRLARGLHNDEAAVGAHWRWTKGELILDPQFWAGLTGQIALFVNHNAQSTREWIPPAEVVPAKSKSRRRLYSVR